MTHDRGALAHPVEAVGDSLVVAGWTMVSRVTGVVRVVVVGAVLGPTLFGNLYQATSALPHLVYYGLLAGSLLSSLLVPVLVRTVDTGDVATTARVAGGFLGVLLAGLALVLPLLLLVVPELLAASASGPAAEVLAAERVARWFVVLLLPQILLYAIAGCAAAVLHAHRRFALAAAAPALDNIGCVTTLVVVALMTGGPLAVADASTAQLVLLGGGTTAAVALNAGLQWVGARRCGVVVRPHAGWRDPGVTAVLRRSVPALAHSGLGALQLLAALLVVNRVPGGVVAFQIALNFYFLPLAICATPVALSLLPRLSRFGPDQQELFRDSVLRGLRFALFLTVPAAVLVGVLAPGLARAVSFGALDTPRGHLLVAVALSALAVGIVAEAAFLIGTYAAYARGDVRSPLRSMALRAAACGAGLAAALTVDGTAVLVLAGCAVSLAAVIGAAHRLRVLLAELPPGEERLAPSATQVVAAALAMAVPVALLRGPLAAAEGHAAVWVSHALVALLGLGVFVAVAAVLRLPEVGWLKSAVGAKLRRVAVLPEVAP